MRSIVCAPSTTHTQYTHYCYTPASSSSVVVPHRTCLPCVFCLFFVSPFSFRIIPRRIILRDYSAPSFSRSFGDFSRPPRSFAYYCRFVASSCFGRYFILIFFFFFTRVRFTGRPTLTAARRARRTRYDMHAVDRLVSSIVGRRPPVGHHSS